MLSLRTIMIDRIILLPVIKISALVLLVLAALVSSTALQADQGELRPKITEILPVDEAFRFGHYEEGDSLQVFWQVLPGYYLYRDKISVSVDGVEMALELPEGEWRDDEVFGRVQVFDGLIQLAVPVPAEGDEVNVAYQGCAAQGYCYPPQKKQINSGKDPALSRKSPF